jgi:hypothetical protein
MTENLSETAFVYLIWDTQNSRYVGSGLTQKWMKIWPRYADATRAIKRQRPIQKDRYEIHQFYLMAGEHLKVPSAEAKLPTPRKPGRLRPYGPRRNTFKGEQA